MELSGGERSERGQTWRDSPQRGLARVSRHILCLSIEASGDRILAEVLRALKQIDATWRFVGIGGEASRAEGLESLIDPRDLAAHGLSEALGALPATLRAWRALKRLAVNVDGYLFVDAPELSVRLLRWVKRHRDHQVRARPVFYLAPPQAWAWRPRRAHLLRVADFVGCLFPFSARWYQTRGVEASYIGHPLRDLHLASTTAPRSSYVGWRAGADVLRVALFPGSRSSSVRRALPILLSACSTLAQERKLSVEARVAETSWISVELYQSAYQALDLELGARGWQREAHHTWRAPRGGSLSLNNPDIVVENSTALGATQPHPALYEVDLALCYAGTSTLESALAGVPPLTIAPLSRLSAYIARRVVRLDHCALPNLILSRRAFPELLPWESDSAQLSALLGNILTRSEQTDASLSELYSVDIADLRTALTPLQSQVIAKKLACALSRPAREIRNAQ